MIKKLFNASLRLGASNTARHLYWVFSGNALSIVLTFFTTILIANSITKAENGIFLALYTLANLLSELGEAGIGSALSSFIPSALLGGDKNQAVAYLSAAFKLELIIGGFIAIFISLFSPLVSHALFADIPYVNVVIIGAMTLFQILFGFSSFALSAYKQFKQVAFISIFYSIIRLVFLGALILTTELSLTYLLLIYTFSALFAWI